MAIYLSIIGAGKNYLGNAPIVTLWTYLEDSKKKEIVNQFGKYKEYCVVTWDPICIDQNMVLFTH